MSDKYPGGFITDGAPAGYSVAFDGTGDYLTVPASSNFAPGTGNFTVDGWIYPTSSAIQRFWAQTTSGTNYFCCEADVPNKTIRFIGTSSGGGTPILSAATLQINQWNYFCISRTSGTVTVWCNGSAGTPTSNTTDFSNTSYVPTISGYTHSTSSEPIIGYLAGLRYIKGTALSGAVAPTVAFPVTNTQLLTCQSPTIIDLSTNALTITVYGDAKVSNFTPFAGYTAGAAGFNPALGAAAPGVWTLDQAEYYQGNRLWPIYDPYFKNTTLLLNGNGTNGAQNNTFLDSSTNNFTITRNGNTTQGTFSPFSQTGWSNYFASGSDYFSFSSNAAFSFGTGDFTIEFLYYPNALTLTNNCFLDTRAAGGNTTGVFVKVGDGAGGGTTTVYATFGGSTFSCTGLVASTWNHVAVTRNGTTVRVYINGISGTSGTSSQNLSDTALLINKFVDSSNGIAGYLSNIRLVKGTAIYTGPAFTPPIAPLTVVTGTSLLTAQSNRFVDTSANAFTLTVNGTPSVQAFSPFVPAYITPTTYSNWFDGTGDYLTVPDSTNLELGSGDFTIECWINTTVSNGGYVSAVSKWGTSNQSYMIRAASTDIGSGWSFFYSTNGSNYFTVFGSSINDGGWHHVAVTRSGNVFTTFTDGVLKNTTTDAVTLYNGTSSVTIGAGDAGANPFTGVISNLRIVKGTALYTASFTPPTAPLTAITNTQLLTCQSSTFIDNSANAATLTANGNVQPVTSPTPFPAKVDTTTLNSAYSTTLVGGSAYFDGTGDFLNTATSSAAFNLNGVSWTIECFVYLGDYTGDARIWAVVSSSTNMYAAVVRSGTLYITQVGVGEISLGSITKGQWYHLAFVNVSGTITCYKNGVSAGTAGYSFPNTDCSFYVAATPANYANSTTQGYISSLRVLKGTAQYTASFTPPTAPPTAITNTSLLLNYTNAGIIDGTSKNVLETVGNAQISTTQSKWGGGAIYSAASTDYLTGKSLFLGSGDFTIEAWVYPLTFPGSQNSLLSFGTSDLVSTCIVYLNSAGTLSFYNNAVIATSTSTASANTWSHIAVVRNSGTIKLYINGTQSGSAANTNNISDTTVQIFRGFGGITTPITGYMDDIRITRYARYTANFTPPTSQLQQQ